MTISRTKLPYYYYTTTLHYYYYYYKNDIFVGQWAQSWVSGSVVVYRPTNMVTIGGEVLI